MSSYPLCIHYDRYDFMNSKLFQKTSQEYKDACDLWDLYVNTRNELIAEALGESSKQDPGRRRSLRKVSTMEGDDDDEDEEEKSDDTKVCISIFYTCI